MQASVETMAEDPMKDSAATTGIAARAFVWLRRAVRKLGPYVMLELLMPGGTLLALLLLLYRRGLFNAAWRAS